MKKIKWVKDNFDSELKEFKRTCEYFTGTSDHKINNENLNFLRKQYTNSNLVDLKSEDWSRMQNTDSWKTDTVLKIERALTRNNEHRDLGRIFYQYASLVVNAPIAIRLESGKLYLVGGNTRLMAARTLDVTPKIIIINTDW